MVDYIILYLSPRFDPDDAPRIGDVYVREGRERIIVDRAFSDDGSSVTLWFEEEA